MAASLIIVVQDGAASVGSQLAAEADEASFVAALRAGEEAAFRDLVTRYHASLVRLARASVASHAVAEEMAQDTWLAVIKGFEGFEGRSSLKTWIIRILVNQARKRGAREHRSSPCRLCTPTAAVAILRPWTRTVSCPTTNGGPATGVHHRSGGPVQARRAGLRTQERRVHRGGLIQPSLG